MRISQQTIKAFKGESSDLKKLFTSPDKPQGVKDLIDLTASRIKTGREACLRDARIYWAVDQAYEAAFKQVPYTMVRGLIDQDASDDTILSAAKDWGLTHMLVDSFDPSGRKILNSDKTPCQKLDVPTFFNIFVPVVAAYTKARWGKLYNDRDLYPLLKYGPLKLTEKERLRCEIITDNIERKTTDFGYRSVIRQAIFQTLQYAECLTFPSEDWYVEYGFSDEKDKDGKPKKRIIKEGLRIAIPHRSRTFRDSSHRLGTFNTDTGCSYAGYWDAQRYSEVKAQKLFWNTDQLAAGRLDFLNTADWRLYQELFPCYAKYPHRWAGASSNYRLDMAFYDSAQDGDMAVNVQPIFQKLVPKDWDLFDCDQPLWFRMVMANDVTPLYCSPLCYSPVVAYLYDYDENRGRNASLALELLPWQDHLGNYLTQYLLTVKKNLAKVVFWNTEILDEAEILRIRNLGEKMYRETQFIPFNSRELGFQKTNAGEAFHAVNFPQGNTAEIVGCINTMITIMERMLGFSAQELGAPAVHEQSATELNVIQSNTSTRLDFTGGFIDDGIAAFKRQLYDSLMAYSDDEVFAQVGELSDAKRQALKDLGFTIDEESTNMDGKAGIKGDKSTLEVQGFASDRDGTKRIQDSKIAATMIQTFQAMFSNPLIVQSVGISNLIGMFNQILIYAGLPTDFKLKVDEKAIDPAAQQEQQQKQAQAVQQQLAQIAMKVSQEVVGKSLVELADGLKAKVFAPMEQQIVQATQGVQQVGQGVQQVSQAVAQTQQALQAMQQAIVELAKHSQTGEQHDGAQDMAIAKLAQIMQTAVGPTSLDQSQPQSMAPAMTLTPNAPA